MSFEGCRGYVKKCQKKTFQAFLKRTYFLRYARRDERLTFDLRHDPDRHMGFRVPVSIVLDSLKRLVTSTARKNNSCALDEGLVQRVCWMSSTLRSWIHGFGRKAPRHRSTRVLGKPLHQDQRTLTEPWELLVKNITLLVSLTPLVKSYS